MHICVVSPGYPFGNQNFFTFAKQLCEAMADLGVKVSVISPQSITKRFMCSLKKEPKYRVEFTKKGNPVAVYAPLTLSFSRFGENYNINFKLYRAAVRKVIKYDLKSIPDVFYGHFWHSAYAVYKCAKEMDIPVFVATGESSIFLHKMFSPDKLKDFTEYVRGVICVSTKNMEESINNKLTIREKCEIFPNAIDPDKFYLKDKTVLRNIAGYQLQDFIVVFVGAFINRKGANRVGEAITKLEDDAIKSIFIGKDGDVSGKWIPKCEGILYKGAVKHEKIVDYLNCADVFVLPTLNEGCCNAIIEAMACGLPIISSDRSFNYDILDNSCSILVDPMNPDEIADAIALLKTDSQLRLRLSKGALKKASNLTIVTRAQRILEFINDKNMSK